MAFTHALAINNYGTAKIIVSTSAANGTHTTIASALTDATSGDTIFIRPGTYTENLTLKAGVNLTAYGSDSSLNGTGKVIISGTCTLTTAGSVTISGIQLQTNSAALLAITGSAASIVNLFNCYLNCTNNSGITYSSSDSGSAININNCFGDIGTTGIALFSHSSSGNLNIYFSEFMNSGGTSTANTVSAGTLTTRSVQIRNPITTSGTGAYNGSWTRINSSSQNVTALTIGGSGNGSFFFGALTSGTASALSIGATYNLVLSDISSSNTNAVTGAGTINLYSNTFSSSSNKVNTTTQTGGAGNGITQGTAPSAGFIGEQIRSAVLAGSAVTLTVSTTVYDITSISLTAGVWDVSAIVSFSPGAITGTNFSGGVSGTSATLGTAGDQRISSPTAPTGVAGVSLTIPSYRVTTSSTITYYLTASATFSVGTPTAFGRISATRVG